MSKHKVVHFEIPASDFKKAKDFYGKIFGWKMDMWGDYMMATTMEMKNQKPVEAGGINGGFYKRRAKKEQPSFVIETDSIEKTLEKVKKAGGKIRETRRPVGDIGFMAGFTDLDGNEMTLWEEAKKNSSQR